MVSNYSSGDVSGQLVQVGANYGVISVPGERAARSYYLEQVRNMAPRLLEDRERELVLLADFCNSPTDWQYLRLVAPAWSGKSALLSWFVLNPPPGVVPVSFFITANSARHNDRRAFVDTVVEQLSSQLGLPFPHDATEFTRESHLLGLLASSAQAAQACGDRLILVIDGLDEDYGVDGTWGAHSIAALLPIFPPWGMRVIVSGRPNPPLPSDLPDHHPLHDAATAHQLAPYAKGQAVRGAMQRDLKRLLCGPPTDQDLLGFITAAGGGLSTTDLATLIGTSAWEVNDRLETASGRSFTRFPGAHPGESPDTLVLAHEDLAATAQAMLSTRLPGYRQRLYAWADDHAARGWPADTPEYLLRGYFRMLAQAGEHDRMLSCASDPRRHQRLRQVTGNDAVALAEIAAVQEHVLGHGGGSELATLARLAVHRVWLAGRHSRIPRNLPAAWAQVGKYNHAEQLLSIFLNQVERLDAFTSTAEALHKAGQPARAKRLLAQATIFAAHFHQFVGARPVASLAAAYELTGDHDRAEQVNAMISDAGDQAEALAFRAAEAAHLTDERRARDLVDQARARITSIATPPPDVLAHLAAITRTLGDTAMTDELLSAAETAAQATNRFDHDITTSNAVYWAAKAEDLPCALRLARSISDTERQNDALTSIMGFLAKANLEEARQFAHQAPNPLEICNRLATAASITCTPDQAEPFIADIEEQRTLLNEPEQAARAMLAIAFVKARIGDGDEAITIVRSHASHRTLRIVLSIAYVLIDGHRDHAIELLALVEKLAQHTASPEDQRKSVEWVRVALDFNEMDRAEQVAESFDDPTARSAAWAAIAAAAAARGHIDRAGVAHRRIEDANIARRPHLDLVRALCGAELHTRAVETAQTDIDPVHRANALVIVAAASRQAGHFASARQAIETLPDPTDRGTAFLHLIEAAIPTANHTLIDELRRALSEVAIGVLANTPEGERRRHHMEDLLRYCTEPLRSLRVLAEETRSHLKFNHPAADPGDKIPLSPLLRPKRSIGKDRDSELAVRLVDDDWRHAVKDLLAAHPDLYQVISTEWDNAQQYTTS